MNKFDRIIAILISLQTKRIVTAQSLADRFEVSLRTIYRDIRTLENAGVPIGAEAGVGYYIEKSYQLPPIMFEQEEAVSLVVGEKFVQQHADTQTATHYINAVHKVKSVLKSADKEYLDNLSEHIEVSPEMPVRRNSVQENWLLESQRGIAQSRVLALSYRSSYKREHTQRKIEPIGLYHYGGRWHLIAWCQLREAYRDFRLDRILNLEITDDRFNRYQRSSLQDYIQQMMHEGELISIVVSFTAEIARYVDYQRYLYGFVEEKVVEDRVEMLFLASSFERIGRWLLTYTNGVEVISPQPLKEQMRSYLAELLEVYSDGEAEAVR